MLDLTDAAVTAGIAVVTAGSTIAGFWHRAKNGIAAAHSAHGRADKLEQSIADVGKATAKGLQEIKDSIHNIEIKIVEERAANERRFVLRSDIRRDLATLNIRIDKIMAAVCPSETK